MAGSISRPGYRRVLERTALGFLLVLGALPAAPLAAQSGAAQEAPAHRLQELRRKIEADNRADPGPSVAFAEEALRILDTAPDPLAETFFCTALVRDCTILNQRDKAGAALARGRAAVSRTGDTRSHLLLEVEAATMLSFQDRASDAKLLLDGLLPAMEAAWSKAPKDPDLGSALTRAYRVLGTVCRNLGRYTEGITAFQRGQQLSEARGDQVSRARILSQMGVLYMYLGRLDDAVASQEAAIALAEAIGDLSLQASLHLSLANTFGYRNEADRQLSALSLAATLAARGRDLDTQLTAAVNLADAYLRKKDYRATLRCAEESLRMAQAAGNGTSVAVSQINRGIALNRLGNSAEGLKAIQEGLAYFKTSQDLHDTAELTGVLAEEYAFAGDYRRAYDAQVLFKTLSDNLSRAQDKKHIAEASAAFDNDKKQIQIDALQRDRKNQARLRLLWTALCTLGFATAGVLVLFLRKLSSANNQLADLSLRDPLTSLANRRYLATRIEEDLAQAVRLQRNGLSEAGKARTLLNIDVLFLMIDVDYFKSVNDEHGHGAGDLVLKQFAAILSHTMRDSDTVVRWGGEEFFIVAKHTSRQDAKLVAERIRSRVAEFPFDVGNGLTIHRTCSIGYSSYPFFRREPSRIGWEKVAEVADQCLYAAKAMGRDTWVGVHEAEEVPGTFQQEAGLYPDVADLVARGILRAESKDERDIRWAG